MRILQILLPGFFLLFSMVAHAQSSPQMISRFEKEWKAIDSLLAKDLPQSAAKQLGSLEQKLSDPAEKLKAQIYRMSIAMQNMESADSFSIAFSEAQIAKAAFPQKAIWQSIAAEQYWSYYQNHRYEILQRTATTDSIADFAFWDGRRFAERAAALYRASISNAAGLKAIPVGQYDAILIKGENTRQLRPTLFDLLAFRAIGYFENDEKDFSRPAFQFVMDDPAAFASAEEFARHRFNTLDTTSMQLQALQLYQEVVRLHLGDASPDPIIDAELQRLAFTYRHSVLPDKKDRYRAALERIEQKYASNPLSAQASFLLAQLMMDEQPATFRRGKRPAPQAKNLPAVRTKLEAIVAKFPRSEGGVNAAQLLQSILAPALSITAEEAVLPGTPSKVLLTYRNRPRAWVRVVKMDPKDYREEGRYQSDNYSKKLLGATPVQAFSVALPGTDDLAEHRAEVKIGALPTGMYAILVSGSERFESDNNLLSFAVCQSTKLAVVMTVSQSAQPKAGFILDRQSGNPVANASVSLLNQRWNNARQRYDFSEREVGPTAADGSFSVPGSDQSISGIILRSGQDQFTSLNYLYFNSRAEPQDRSFHTTILTDRAIYRPGQTVYFKAILIERAPGGRSSKVMGGESTVVTFYDANSQRIDSRKLITNEWGSVSGSFIIPTGGLTGQFRIESGSSSTYFSVEEYKRPKFKVDWDTLKSDYALNEAVTVTGFAQAYAGNNVDGATVKYRVRREVRWPFWWYASRYGGQYSPPQEIASGTATTDASGKFRITFNTLPDRSIDERSLPVFTYVISADVTDINGETRSGTQRVSAGYRSLQFRERIPASGNRADLDTLMVSTTNLNDVFVPATVSIKIARLKQPEVFYRSRQWEVPDQFTMTEAQFRQAFPLDAYKDEADHTTWAEAATTADLTIRTTKRGEVAMPAGAFTQNGWYVVTLKTKDKAGKEIEEKKYLQVWDAANSGRPYAGLLTVPADQTHEPGAKASVYLSSALADLKVIRMQRTMDRKETIAAQELDAPFLLWTKTIDEADRGGIQVSYVTVKDNRAYLATAYVAVPWTNKQLDIEWETHRDKLQPGAAETWTLRIKGSKQEQVAAELAATLYDASLDAFRPHSWNPYSLFASLDRRMDWSTGTGFGIGQGRQLGYMTSNDIEGYMKTYDMLLTNNDPMNSLMDFGTGIRPRSALRFSPPVINPSAPGGRSVETAESVQIGGARTSSKKAIIDGIALQRAEDQTLHLNVDSKSNVEIADQPLRKNLQETAFFFPQLRTEADGSVKIQFTIPEALTEWNLLTFAHTNDMKSGVFNGSVKTQKDLMVQPGLPRFLRQGDAMTISTKIVNLSDKALSGTATLEILDANTLQPLALPFRLTQPEVAFKTAAGGSTAASWTINVPESRYEPVIIRIRAKAGAFTDGEENALPVLTNRTLVTETLPLWINGTGTKTFDFGKLQASGESKTLAQHALTVEYTANPAWLAVQALPYLMEYPFECAEQTFNQYYANALGAHILSKAPKVKAIFQRWESLDTAALQSALSKNEELKSALLEETPWVLDAQSETAQKHNLALLFNTAKLAASLSSSARKLEDMALPEGGWPWFKGTPRPDRYITQYILTGIGRLKQLGITDRHLERITTQALAYADRSLEAEYQQLLKAKLDMSKQRPSNSALQWMYMRSFFKEKSKNVKDATVAYFTKQSVKFWPEMNPYGKGVTAIALKRGGDAATPKVILQSLRETAIQKEELGMYWLEPGRSWAWWEAPIETQALLIEAFTEVENDAANVDRMKRWLLKQKQTQNWPTTKATADACYALLLRGDQWLTAEPQVTITLGDKTIRSSDQRTEAGTGYFKTRIPGAEVRPEMGAIKLNVSSDKPTTQPSWGAVYWQYFENTDKVTAAATPLQISKTLYIQRDGDRGPVLEPVSGQLKTGDKLVVRLEIAVDREMEYVHLKDGRAACMEPVNVLSGYRWKGGLGYYESTRDASSNFFFDYLPKGKHVLEYPVFISGSGDYSNGLATIQCMYAPEFNAHSAGGRVVVRP